MKRKGLRGMRQHSPVVVAPFARLMTMDEEDRQKNHHHTLYIFLSVERVRNSELEDKQIIQTT